MDLTSSLLNSANNIVRLNRSTVGMKKTQSTYNDFLRFMDVEVASIQSLKFNKKKLDKALAANVTTTFGNAGNLLSGLFSGSLDAASFVGDFFGGKDKKKLQKPNVKSGKPIPKGTKVRIPGVRALGVLTPLLAGLDFAQGVSEGESVGKSASGAIGSAVGYGAGAAAGGALAGAITAGMIGQGLVPIPGLGFVLGAAVGGLGAFAGGYLADRAYESFSGEKNVKEKVTSKLKEQEAKQKALAASATTLTISQVMNKFDTVVFNFERLVSSGILGPSLLEPSQPASEEDHEMIEGVLDSPPNTNEQSGESGSYDVSGGFSPSSKRYSLYGPRGGRNHNGIDYSVSAGTPISVIQPGTVTVANMNYDPSGWGALVEVQHADGSTTRYAHLSKITVSRNQKIEPGTLIGYSGGVPGSYGAGNSRGEHLHYEYLPKGSGAVDPAKGNNDDKYFRFGGNIKVKPKVTSQTGFMGSQSGGKFAVVATGTNTSSDPEKVKRDTLQIINDLRRKGYTPIIVPPNESAYSAAYRASVEAAKTGGAQIEKGTYSSSDPLHLTQEDANRIRNKYKGAEFIGDSNAVRIAGNDMQGRRVVGSQTSAAVQYARNLPNIAFETPAVGQPQVLPLPQQKTVPQQIQQYPSYNLPQSSVTLIPISGGNSQTPMVVSSRGGSQTVIVPPPPEGQLLNSLMKNILLTTLSST